MFGAHTGPASFASGAIPPDGEKASGRVKKAKVKDEYEARSPR